MITCWLVYMVAYLTRNTYADGAGTSDLFSTLMPTCFASKGRAATVSGIINSLIYGGSAVSIYAFGAIAEYIGWNAATAIWLGLALGAAVIMAFAIKPWQSFLKKETR